MRKIAIISEHASPLTLAGSTASGSQNVYVAHIATELAELGYVVDVFTRCDDSAQAIVVNWRPSVRVIHVPAGPPCLVPWKTMMPFMDVFARFMIRFARSENIQYDLVHANFFMSGMVAQRIRKALGIPFVMSFHALERVCRRDQGDAGTFPDARVSIETELMRESDLVIAECPQDKAEMEERYGADPSRIEVIPCGFDPEEFWPVTPIARRVLGLDEREFILLQFGWMVPCMGIDLAIRTLACLHADHGLRARLMIIDSSSAEPDPVRTPEIGRLMALADSLKVSSMVSFIGQLPRGQLRYYYSAANIFIATPGVEPGGIRSVEAMACATPVIASAVDGIRHTVVDGQTGYLVAPDSPSELAEKIALLEQRPQLARRLGRAGLRRAHLEYSWRNVTSMVASAYERILQSSVAGHPANRNWHLDSQMEGVPQRSVTLPATGAGSGSTGAFRQSGTCTPPP